MIKYNEFRTGFGKTAQERLDESNKGHQLLKKMGWSGAGLGSKEQGIDTPISSGDVSNMTIAKMFCSKYKIILLFSKNW